MEMSKSFQQIRAYARKNRLPVIPIRANGVSIINEPNTFYKSILAGIDSSKQRLSLSALYLGTGPKEEAIVQAICDNVQHNCGMKVNISLDANRARRLDDRGRSSVTVLERLMLFSNVTLNLIETRSETLMSKLLARIQRWNEILSTFHSKLLVFDDNVLVTGANLSRAYFERRQDRYIMFEGSQMLGDYIYNLLERVNRQDAQSMKQTIRNFNDHYSDLLSRLNTSGESDSYVIPLTQFGPSGINEKEDFLQFISSILPKEAHLHLSTGYFNPSATINALNISSVLAPSEQTNGFYEGGGFLSYVPKLYSALHKQYIDCHQQCDFMVYDKPGWSFHAKGMWVEGLGDLYIHLVGSSNFNCRSSERDFETQLVILTKNRDLAEKLHQERVRLWSESIRLKSEDIQGLNPIYSTLAKLLKSFL